AATASAALRCVSKHEGGTRRPILRDAHTRDLICGSACARALLRMRTGERVQTCGSSLNRWPYFNLTMSNSPSRSRGAFLRPGFATLLHSPRIEGWAERRETFGCSAEHP